MGERIFKTVFDSGQVILEVDGKVIRWSLRLPTLLARRLFEVQARISMLLNDLHWLMKLPFSTSSLSRIRHPGHNHGVLRFL